MTTAAPDPLQVLLDRACRRLAPAEAEQLRAAIGQLRRTAGGLQAKVQQQAAQLDACHNDIHVMAERIVDLAEEQKRTARYRAAWRSARARANTARAAAATPTTVWSGQRPFTAIDLQAPQ